MVSHGPQVKHLFNIRITDRPLSIGCVESEETPAHVLLYCKSESEQLFDGTKYHKRSTK